MQTTPSRHPITPERIRTLLEQLQGAGPASPDYYRLMEIYCVVKAGGRGAQMEAARQLEQRERAELEAAIQALPPTAVNASRVEALQQEIQELQTAIAQRLSYLKSISTAEEAAVRQCLNDIEAHFQGQGGSHDGC